MAAVVAVLEGVGPAPLVGYSQGGRIAILVSLQRPDLVHRLVAVSASPGVADRVTRQRDDDALAKRITNEGIGAFLDEWLTGPPVGTDHLPDDVRAPDRVIREQNTAEGLAAALRGYGQGAQPYVMDRLTQLAGPTLFVAGERDVTYSRLAEEMAGVVPHGRVEIVPGVGHNVVLEAPGALAALIGAET